MKILKSPQVYKDSHTYVLWDGADDVYICNKIFPIALEQRKSWKRFFHQKNRINFQTIWKLGNIKGFQNQYVFSIQIKKKSQGMQ